MGFETQEFYLPAAHLATRLLPNFGCPPLQSSNSLLCLPEVTVAPLLSALDTPRTFLKEFFSDFSCLFPPIMTSDE